METDTHCPKCGNRHGLACTKCHNCGHDYFKRFDSVEPQTTPIKSAESEAKELLIELDQIAVNYDNYEYGLPTHTEPQYSEMIAQVMLFASLQTTAKEKEFCERLGEIVNSLTANITEAENDESTQENEHKKAYFQGYISNADDVVSILNELIQNYKK